MTNSALKQAQQIPHFGTGKEIPVRKYVKKKILSFLDKLFKKHNLQMPNPNFLISHCCSSTEGELERRASLYFFKSEFQFLETTPTKEELEKIIQAVASVDL
jgi:hypothetical protein